MSILVLGSINVDHVYRVAHLPAAGETLAASALVRGLGGKGANQALAAARAGASVAFFGAVGPDGGPWVAELAAAGVATGGIATVEAPTGHAIVCVDAAGENQIVILAGANAAPGPATVAALLAAGRPGDWLLTQNETTAVPQATAAARAAGLRTAHAAAPFDAGAAAPLLPDLDLLSVNAGEAAALRAALGPAALDRLPRLVVTLGAEGALYRGPEGVLRAPAFPVRALDTTGAGDTFLGVLVAGLDGGLGAATALTQAAAAAALQVTRPGAAPAIPTAAETAALMAANSGIRAAPAEWPWA